MFEASAYDELLSAARNVETDPDRLWRAIEHHTKLAEPDRRRSLRRGRQAHPDPAALLHTVEQTYLRQDEEALVAEENAYEVQITRDDRCPSRRGGPVMTVTPARHLSDRSGFQWR